MASNETKIYPTWEYNDGGRSEAGYKGTTGDCVTRAIAIATGTPYQKVYDDLFAAGKVFAQEGRSKAAKRAAKRGGTPRKGVVKSVYAPYIEGTHGWLWTPTMAIGSGCTVHLKADELPSGRLIVRCSKHLCAVVDGVIHDTHDPSREGSRCVYGYWSKAVAVVAPQPTQ